MDDKNTEKNIVRPPIVVVMGHVDHGKTSLLDYIRKSNVASKEDGGITQSIGAYEIERPSKEIFRQAQNDFALKNRKITFIDTPGHEAFSKMRSRGANVADLAILVVAADDGVQPQTKESITTLQKTETPFVIAINKIDVPNADIDRVKNELLRSGVLLEGLGGNISWQEISAKTGKGIEELLDLVLLIAEVENLRWNKSKSGEGVIIEAKMDPQRGHNAVAIVKDGVLKYGTYIKTATATGKIKILENFLGKAQKELIPSSPALITGWEKLPLVGEKFVTDEKQFESNQIAIPQRKSLKAQEEVKDNLKIIIKADASGSVEAMAQVLKELKVNDSAGKSKTIEILNQGVGDISESDIKEADTKNAVIVGFRVKLNRDAQNLILGKKVRVITHEIIYDLVKKLEEELRDVLLKTSMGELEILAVFDQKSIKKQIVGGVVKSGTILKKNPILINRDNKEVGQAKIINLQQSKKDVSEVKEGRECGLLIESDIIIRVGDKLICIEARD